MKGAKVVRVKSKVKSGEINLLYINLRCPRMYGVVMYRSIREIKFMNKRQKITRKKDDDNGHKMINYVMSELNLTTLIARSSSRLLQISLP